MFWYHNEASDETGRPWLRVSMGEKVHQVEAVVVYPRPVEVAGIYELRQRMVNITVK